MKKLFIIFLGWYFSCATTSEKTQEEKKKDGALLQKLSKRSLQGNIDEKIKTGHPLFIFGTDRSKTFYADWGSCLWWGKSRAGSQVQTKQKEKRVPQVRHWILFSRFPPRGSNAEPNENVTDTKPGTQNKNSGQRQVPITIKICKSYWSTEKKGFHRQCSEIGKRSFWQVSYW